MFFKCEYSNRVFGPKSTAYIEAEDRREAEIIFMSRFPYENGYHIEPVSKEEQPDVES